MARILPNAAGQAPRGQGARFGTPAHSRRCLKQPGWTSLDGLRRFREKLNMVTTSTDQRVHPQKADIIADLKAIMTA